MPGMPRSDKKAISIVEKLIGKAPSFQGKRAFKRQVRLRVYGSDTSRMR